MPTHPLISDQTITISATLAATIGLDEAVLLAVLNNAASLQHQNWARLNSNTLRKQLPFWNDTKIQQVMHSFISNGLVAFNGPLFPQAEGIIYNFNQLAAQTSPQPAPQAAVNPAAQPVPQSRPAPAPMQQQPAAPIAPTAATQQAGVNRTQPIQQNWQPNPDTLRRLEQHGIQPSFALAHLDTFVLQSQEQGLNRNDWNSRFFNHVKSKAVFAQNDANRKREPMGFQPNPEKSTPMYPGWEPREEAMEILVNAGINQQFVLDTVPEFVLYWSERGTVNKTWNSKFIVHVRMQWERFIATDQDANKPTVITESWRPSVDCYDIIDMAHIDREFAEQLVPEFILYWSESKQALSGWNSRFLQYIKQQWAKRLTTGLTTGDTHGHQTAAKPNYTTAQGSIQRLSDTSWAK